MANSNAVFNRAIMPGNGVRMGVPFRRPPDGVGDMPAFAQPVPGAMPPVAAPMPQPQPVTPPVAAPIPQAQAQAQPLRFPMAGGVRRPVGFGGVSPFKSIIARG